MSPTIHYQGKEYEGLEAMPPDVRSSYEIQQSLEEAQRALDQVQASTGGGPVAGMETFAPAWGGARPEGGLPAPTAFEGVSGLGPAQQVFEHQGGDLDLRHLLTPHARAAVLYRDGFAYQAGGKDVHAWRWEDVAAVESNFVEYVGTHDGVMTGANFPMYEYTLVNRAGDKLILNDGLKDVAALGNAIKKAVFALIGPPLGQRYKLGEGLTFGPVTVQRPSGIQMDGKPFAWGDVQDIKIENGRLTVTLHDGKKHAVRANAIPNVEVLCQLLGVAGSDFDLTYWPGL